MGEILDKLDLGIIDMALLSSNLSASARRQLTSLLTKFYALVETRGGVNFFSAYSHGDSRLLSYHSLEMICDDLKSGVNSDELTLIFTHLDTQDSGYISLDALTYSMVAAWRASTRRIWLEIRKSALGQLKGEQAARVLTEGRSWVAYPDFTAALGDNGINLVEEDVMLLLVQLGSSIEGVVHGLDFGAEMDDQVSLATTAAYARILGVLSMENVSLKDSLEALDSHWTGSITQVQFVEFLRTLDIRLSAEDLELIIVRLEDVQNSGRIRVVSFLEDVAVHTKSEKIWSKISDTLGPSGGAQLEAFLGEGTAMANSTMLAALRQLGIDLTDQEFEWMVSVVDPRGTKYVEVEKFVQYVQAYRERIIDVVWLKVSMFLKRSGMVEGDILSSCTCSIFKTHANCFPVGHEGVQECCGRSQENCKYFDIENRVHVRRGDKWSSRHRLLEC